jgi:uracil-DNA glycosylase family 4
MPREDKNARMQDAIPDRRALIALLEWYEAAGVDAVVGASPVDRFRALGDAPPAGPTADAPAAAARPDRPAARVPARAFEPLPPATPAAPAAVPDENAVAAARSEAAGAASLEELRAALERFEGCNLKRTATQLVFADGNPAGRVMLVGEAPGRDEDIQGRPFVGRSGQLLDRMLAAIGLDRTKVYIANVVPWRPPGNRTPSPQETEICKPFIARQIALADPDVLIFLGGASAKAVTGATEGILKLRGRWSVHDTGLRRIPSMATLHPAYLLRQPMQKRLAWRDFLSLKRVLEGREP